MRREESAHLFWRGQAAVDQFQKDGLHQIAIAGQLGVIRNSCMRLWEFAGGTQATLSGTG